MQREVETAACQLVDPPTNQTMRHLGPDLMHLGVVLLSADDAAQRQTVIRLPELRKECRLRSDITHISGRGTCWQ